MVRAVSTRAPASHSEGNLIPVLAGRVGRAVAKDGVAEDEREDEGEQDGEAADREDEVAGLERSRGAQRRLLLSCLDCAGFEREKTSHCTRS